MTFWKEQSVDPPPSPGRSWCTCNRRNPTRYKAVRPPTAVSRGYSEAPGHPPNQYYAILRQNQRHTCQHAAWGPHGRFRFTTPTPAVFEWCVSVRTKLNPPSCTDPAPRDPRIRKTLTLTRSLICDWGTTGLRWSMATSHRTTSGTWWKILPGILTLHWIQVSTNQCILKCPNLY